MVGPLSQFHPWRWYPSSFCTLVFCYSSILVLLFNYFYFLLEAFLFFLFKIFLDFFLSSLYTSKFPVFNSIIVCQHFDNMYSFWYSGPFSLSRMWSTGICKVQSGWRRRNSTRQVALDGSYISARNSQSGVLVWRLTHYSYTCFDCCSLHQRFSPKTVSTAQWKSLAIFLNDVLISWIYLEK